MELEVSEHQPKQERLRTRWTASLDKIFADLVVEQIQLGNRRNNVFNKKSWNHVRDEFNRQTNLSFNNNQLRKHLDVLRIRYHSLKFSSDQNDFVMDDSCCIGFDLWDIGAEAKPETTNNKECHIFQQLCTIFADLGADGKYAQSSHYEGLDKPVATNPGGLLPFPENENLGTKSSSKFIQGNVTSADNASKKTAKRKRKLAAEGGSFVGDNSRDQEINNAMAEGMLEMVGALKLHMAVMPQSDESFTITKCIKALDEIEGIDDWLYYAALNLLEDPNLRELFISLKGHKLQWTWLQGRCGNLVS